MKLAVYHPLPGLRRALVDGLGAIGIQAVDNPNDLLGWLEANQPAGAVLPLDHPTWTQARRTLPDATLIALTGRDDPPTFTRAFAAGAAGVVASTWDVERIVQGVQAAIDGSPRIPLHVAHALAAQSDRPPPDLALTAPESQALGLLCEGATIKDIAHQLGYSHRHLRRLLANLYQRMGVTGRTEAIVAATQWGICDT